MHIQVKLHILLHLPFQNMIKKNDLMHGIPKMFLVLISTQLESNCEDSTIHLPWPKSRIFFQHHGWHNWQQIDKNEGEHIFIHTDNKIWLESKKSLLEDYVLLYGSVDPQLVRNLLSAHSEHIKEQEAARKLLRDKRFELGVVTRERLLKLQRRLRNWTKC